MLVVLLCVEPVGSAEFDHFDFRPGHLLDRLGVCREGSKLLDQTPVAFFGFGSTVLAEVRPRFRPSEGTQLQESAQFEKRVEEGTRTLDTWTDKIDRTDPLAYDLVTEGVWEDA